MLQTLGKILGSIVRSLFISIVMFIIVFSVITGEFPPNFGRIKSTYQSLQKMTQLSRQIFDQQKVLKGQYQANGEVDEADVSALEELNLKRAELGASILQGGPSPSMDSQEVKDLRKQMAELEKQVFKLQHRVNQLEAKVR